jgi:spermidine/putrescine transport system substrate-binding protein
MEINQILSGSVSRRRFLEMAGASILSSQTMNGVFAQGAPLNWFAFGTIYSDPYLLEPFVKGINISVKQTPWTGADEMLAKLRGGGAQLFDCASIPQQFVRQLAKDGVIEAIDPANVANFTGLFPEFKNSPYVNADGKIWGVPWIWGANAIAYNKKYIPSVTSMSSLFDEKNKGRISMRDDPEDSLAVAALYLGIKEPFKMDDRELAEVKKLLVIQKALIRSYWRNVSDLQTLFANDEISISWAQLAIIEPLRRGSVDMGWVWPTEGVLGFFNGQCTIKGTARKKEAEAFANFLIGPDYGVRLAEKTGYATTSDFARAKMSPELVAKAGIDPSRLRLLKFKELIPNRPVWQRIWDEVKAA